jgi:hypothetical protein
LRAAEISATCAAGGASPGRTFTSAFCTPICGGPAGAAHDAIASSSKTCENSRFTKAPPTCLTAITLLIFSNPFAALRQWKPYHPGPRVSTRAGSGTAPRYLNVSRQHPEPPFRLSLKAPTRRSLAPAPCRSWSLDRRGEDDLLAAIAQESDADCAAPKRAATRVGAPERRDRDGVLGRNTRTIAEEPGSLAVSSHRCARQDLFGAQSGRTCEPRCASMGRDMKAGYAFAAAFVGSLAVLCCVTAFWQPPSVPGGDADQYLAIARSLAEGKGYRDTVGPWPGQPAYDRMPGWPAVLSIALWLAPGVAPEMVARFTNAFCLSLAGALFSVLTLKIGVRPWLAIPAAFSVALSPLLVYLSVVGDSEVSFLLFVAAGLLGILAGGRWFYLGALTLGLAPLVRANFVLVPPMVFALALLAPGARGWLLRKRNLFRATLALTLALAPTFSWLLRNYSVTGRFLFLSSIEGETLYGSNNDIVANDLGLWGRWIMPDQIPGETPKLELAKRVRSDLELNDYYHRKGITWIKANLPALPRLVLGKLVRAFVPIPWVPLLSSYVAFSHRFLLGALCLSLAPWWWPALNRTYLLVVLAMLAAHLVTTVVYYADSRFTHCFVEIPFVPCIFLGIERLLPKRAAKSATAKGGGAG